MNVSPDALRKETVATLREVDAVLEAVKEDATLRDIDPARFVDQHGSYILPPLLLAKTQCLVTLTMLNNQRK